MKTISSATLCRAYDLGVVNYDESLQLQNGLVSARAAGKIQDIILLLQHFPVITIGVSGKREDITVPKDLLDDKEISVFHTDRGGLVTYHGPGQLVGYVILDLKNKGKDIHQFVRNLEEVIIRTLDAFSISAYVDPQHPGVWVRGDKICTLGLRVTRWITKHGFALNVNTDMSHFTYIIPCGITGQRVTSMAQLLGHDIDLQDVSSCILEQCATVFDMDIEHRSAEELSSYHDVKKVALVSLSTYES